jgi:hypothetical protein
MNRRIILILEDNEDLQGRAKLGFVHRLLGVLSEAV